jgi:hypothetical protein
MFNGLCYSYGAVTYLSDGVTVLRIQSVEAAVVVKLGRNVALSCGGENWN